MTSVGTDMSPVRAEVLTVQEVAAICSVSTDSVYRAIRCGELEAEEIFGRLRIRRGALKEYRRERRRVLKRHTAGRGGLELTNHAGAGSLRALMRGDRRRTA